MNYGRYHFYIYIILHNYNKIKIEGIFNVTNAINLNQIGLGLTIPDSIINSFEIK